ncbi:MAG: hypothetical protein ACR2MT_07145 [Aurantibacter sp.]
MDKIKQTEKLVSFFLFTGLLLNLFFVYFAQERFYNSVVTGSKVLGPEKYIRILSIICVFITVLLSLFISKNKYRISIFFAYLTLLTTVTLNYVISGADLWDMSQFMHTRGIGTWVCLGLIFVGYHDKRFSFFQKFLFFSTVFIAALSIYNLIDFGVGLWRGQAMSKYQVYAVNMVWICPYVFLILKNNKKLKWFRLAVIFMGLILALITQTRSFLIIYFVTLVFDFYNTKKKVSYTILLVLGFIGFVYMILNTEVFSKPLDLLINRGLDDTRSEQLDAFTSQLSFFELISGKGFFASYRFGSEQWSAVDNQWLYLLWWGGLIPVLCYLYLSVVIPVKMIFRGGLTYETKVECFVLVLWVLALTGLAIFSTMTVDFFFFIVSIILGRVLFKYSNHLG